MKRTRSILVLLYASIVLLAGCNVFAGLEQESTTDPEVLLNDAELALQNGHPEKAVEQLREALDRAPQDGLLRSQIELRLSTALLAERDINVMLLRRIARNFERDQAGAASRAFLFSENQSATLGCKFPDTHGREEFDPVQGIDYERLNEAPSQAALDESQALLERVFSLEETSSDIPFPCDSQGDLDQQIALLQELGLSDAEIAEALVNYAVVLSTRLTVELVEMNDGQRARFFYVNPPDGGEYVSVCMNDVAICQQGDVTVTQNLVRVNCTVRLLTNRADLLNSGTAQEVATMADSWRDRLINGLDQPCYTVTF